MKIVRLVIALSLGIFFIYAGAIKAGKADTFAINIAQYLILPATWWKPTAIAVSLLELVAGIFLLHPVTRRWGAILVLFLMAIFLCALGTALYHGLSISCGCMAAREGTGPTALWIAVARDIVIAIAAIFLIVGRSRSVVHRKKGKKE